MYSKMTRLAASSFWRAGAIAVAVSLAACASKPKPVPVAAAAPASKPAPAIQSLQQYMQEAAQAAADGNNKERARELYRTAARVYPSSKEPWLKLAEDYFESANYGHAILSAQEVMQRDPADTVATSVLAVSGLRVSAAALTALHEQKSKLSGGPRTEAEQLARQLRESLGETELVPQAAPQINADAPARPVARPRPAAAPRRPQATPAAAAPAAPNTAADPFSILKK
jgi:tetratricopeptide (TPR) repeat protein